MAKPVEDLADFVRRMRHAGGISLREAERRSHGRISRGYINQIENRTVLGPNITPFKLVALAMALGVPEDELFAVAFGRKFSEPEAKQLRAMFLFDSLPAEKQDEALDLLTMFSQRYGKPAQVPER